MINTHTHTHTYAHTYTRTTIHIKHICTHTHSHAQKTHARTHTHTQHTLQRADLSLCTGGPEEDLKLVQRTLELLVELDVAVLWQAVGGVADGAVQACRLGFHQLHVATTLATPGKPTRAGSLDRSSYCVLDKVLDLEAKYTRMHARTHTHTYSIFTYTSTNT